MLITCSVSLFCWFQMHPDKRITAEDAMRHRYFQSLPAELYELPDGKPVFELNGYT